MTGTTATPEETVAIQQTIAHLRARVPAAAGLRESMNPAAGSAMAADFAAGHGQDLISHGRAWMLSADGHLLTLAAALSTRDLQSQGPYSLLRGAAEPLAMVTWLFDEIIPPRDRYARLLAERLDNQLERRKLKVFRDHADERITHLTRLAKRAKLKKVPATGRPSHFGQPRPSATELFARVLAEAKVDPSKDAAGELLYRLLCGHTHAAMYALMSQADFSGPRVGNVTLARIELNVFQLMTMLDLVLRMYDAAQVQWCRMFGADVSAWQTLRAGLPPSADLTTLYRGSRRER